MATVREFTDNYELRGAIRDTKDNAERLKLAMANIAIFANMYELEDTLDLLAEADKAKFALAVLNNQKVELVSALNLINLLKKLPPNHRGEIAFKYAEVKTSMNLWYEDILALLPRHIHLEFMRRTKNTEIQKEFRQNLLKQLKDKITQFDDQKDNMRDAHGKDDERYGKYSDAKEDAKNLHHSFKEILNSYFSSQGDEAALATARVEAKKAFAKAEQSSLKDHRGWKEFMVNLLSIFGIIKYAITGSYFFKPETDSIKKVKALEAQCVEMGMVEEKRSGLEI